MSAIGDYIHRTAIGYTIGKRFPRRSDAIIAYRNKENDINKQITLSEADAILEKKAKNLENILNNFLTQDRGNPDYQKLLEEFNNEVFIKEFPQYITNQFLKIKKRSGMSIKEIIPQNDEVHLRTVQSTLKKIQNIINNISKGKVDIETANKLQNIYNNLQNTANQIQTQKGKINVKNNENFFTEINTLINELQFSNELMYAKGKALELFVPFFVDYINKTVKAKIDFTISQKQGGKDSKSLPGIAISNFTQEEGIDLTKVMGVKKEKIDKYSNFIPSINIPTEDKVDFYLAINGSDIGFTAKNYAVSGERFQGITLVKQQSLLTLLQNENQYNFINHYLNVIQPLDCENCNDNVLVEKIVWQRIYYNRLVYILLLLKALTGYNVLKYNDNKIFTTDAAQFLIINDSAASNYTKNNIKVISTKTLIDKILNTPNSTSLSIGLRNYDYNSFASFTLQEQPYKEEDFSTPQARITDILMKVHAQKIHMSLNPDFVRQSMFGYNTTDSKT